MDMKHNFDRFYKCNSCERLYYLSNLIHKDIIDRVNSKIESYLDQSKELEKLLPTCSCGSNLEYYSCICPYCGEVSTKNFEVINKSIVKHEIFYTQLISND